MKKQRICIVGDGLSGLMTALALNKLEGLEVHLISKKNKLLKDKRTTAISASNYDFFNSVVDKLDKKLFWPSNKINLFYETKDQNINFLNFDDKKGLMYIFENDKVKAKLLKEIKKKKINTLQKNINNLKDLKGYDLKILCLGRSSEIYQNIVDKRSLDKDYKEIDSLVQKHLAFFMGNIAKTTFHRITGSSFSEVPVGPELKPYFKKINTFSSVLAMLTDVFLFFYQAKPLSPSAFILPKIFL